MTHSVKNKEQYIRKLNIEKLNAMQEEMMGVFSDTANIQLCSPTGSGKTVAFLLPIIMSLDHSISGVQVLILAPSRELALQIEQVARDMGSGFKVNAVYGGQAISKDKVNLKHPPSILVGTPGRVMDHFRRKTIGIENIRILVLDEFDKSLEVGFEDQMREIIEQLPNLTKKILTSATKDIIIPDFVQFVSPVTLDFKDDLDERIKIKIVESPSKDKLESLVQLISHIGEQPGIIFCNYKESVSRISEFLNLKGIDHGCFFGGLDQVDRERALVKFRNGTHRLLLATDLAARGLDIPELKFIIHYHLPHREEEFVHRNGRTARVKKSGVVYVIKWKEDVLPEFIPDSPTEIPAKGSLPNKTGWQTLYISGGRRDKISKGDIAGFFLKKGGLKPSELGLIELKQECAFVGVVSSCVNKVLRELNNERIKSRKIRIKVV